MLDANLVRTRCQNIHDCIERLKKIQAMTEDAFLQDQDIQDIACYRLQIAIESSISLCYHFSAKKLKKTPEEYAQCFSFLENEGVIDKELAMSLQDMCRFRNLLVHMYWKIDYRVVYDILQNQLTDLEQYCSSIVAQT